MDKMISELNGEKHLIHKRIDVDIVPVRKPGIRLEVFDKEALLLIIENGRLIEMDKYDYWIWSEIDGKRTIKDISMIYSQEFGESKDDSLLKIWTFFRKFFQYNAALDRERNQREFVGIGKKYIQNPDVHSRQEDGNCSLLLRNPTGQVRLLNRTGSYIWNQCKKEQTFDTLLEAFKKGFDFGPNRQDQFEDEINNFLHQMVESGFIRVFENLKNTSMEKSV